MLWPLYQTIDEYDNAYIYCNSSVVPVIWTMLDHMILPNNVIPGSLSLTINGVRKKNQGHYICSGKRVKGDKFMAKSLLLVLGMHNSSNGRKLVYGIDFILEMFYILFQLALWLYRYLFY